MSDLLNAGVSIALAIVGVALLAVLVSRNADTANILTAGGNAFSSDLGVAVSPVTGQQSFHVGNTVTAAGFYN